ncbi:hypothetical protein PGB34_20805 [Xenophilus arseniciresistens]|uniref:Lipoprotein n=1 Tax=Xenophilus arseniciresistens TaxID=1283306 RepID=A0AAE3T141_9BURK|nr:hypothetical protein [Xenophilus arseniciresistens]MDA7418819.1 hypothetical protein [Xenophilus arseniciresistens]
MTPRTLAALGLMLSSALGGCIMLPPPPHAPHPARAPHAAAMPSCADPELPPGAHPAGPPHRPGEGDEAARREGECDGPAAADFRFQKERVFFRGPSDGPR